MGSTYRTRDPVYPVFLDETLRNPNPTALLINLHALFSAKRRRMSYHPSLVVVVVVLFSTFSLSSIQIHQVVFYNPTNNPRDRAENTKLFQCFCLTLTTVMRRVTRRCDTASLLAPSEAAVRQDILSSVPSALCCCSRFSAALF